MFGFKFLGNTRIPHNKNTAEMKPVKMTPPKEVLLSMQQHIGAPATPVVKVGDVVKVGQLIAEPSGYVSSPVYASVSGTVKKIDSHVLPNGNEVAAVRIESDGLMTPYEGLTPPDVHDLNSLLDAVRTSGLVGLGGAGFPITVKIDAAKEGNVHTIVVNAAECEPYVTCDTRTMLDHSDSIFEAVSLIEKVAPSIQKIVFGIEGNKPECIEEMNRIFEGNEKVSVVALPTLYPQGSEEILVYNTTGIVIPEGKLPTDVGVLVINVTSLEYIAYYCRTGMPLVEKCITVDGSAVKEPKNVVAPIGTSIRDIFEFVGVDTEEVGKVLLGGPMMGVAVYSLDDVVNKKTNIITALNHKDSEEPKTTACIHCGRCVDYCPIGLNPTLFSKALTLGNDDKMALLESASINLCMECGCCSYVCPARRPLVQNNRLAKADYRACKAEKSN